MEDARTTQRWYLAVTMGRKSGALALGITKASGATLGVIPEQFGAPPVPLAFVRDTIVGSVIKRRVSGHDHGVAVIAEGIAEMLDPSELTTLKDVAKDAYGNVRLADIDLGETLKTAVTSALRELRLDTTVVTKDIGYELRCAKPLPFDVEYTRTLGYGAVRYLLSGGSGSMVALRGGKVEPVTLQEMLDPGTGRIRVRHVDTRTESYEVGRSYMIKLEPADLNAPKVSALAAAAHLDAREFQKRFEPVVHGG